jgi:hypothetical protein
MPDSSTVYLEFTGAPDHVFRSYDPQLSLPNGMGRLKVSEKDSLPPFHHHKFHYAAHRHKLGASRLHLPDSTFLPVQYWKQSARLRLILPIPFGPHKTGSLTRSAL